MSQIFSEKVKKLSLPPDDFIVIGSGILAQLGIREASDIDLVVTSAVYDALKGQGAEWVEKQNSSSVDYLENSLADVEVWVSLPTEHGELDFAQLVKFTESIDDIRFVSLDFTRGWKAWMGRGKDKLYIDLIDKFLENRYDA